MFGWVGRTLAGRRIRELECQSNAASAGLLSVDARLSSTERQNHSAERAE